MLTEKMLNELVAVLDRETGYKNSTDTVVKIVRKYEELKRKRAGM